MPGTLLTGAGAAPLGIGPLSEGSLPAVLVLLGTYLTTLALSGPVVRGVFRLFESSLPSSSASSRGDAAPTAGAAAEELSRLRAARLIGKCETF